MSEKLGTSKVTPSRVGLCTLSYGEKYKKMTELGLRTKIEYCKKWGYDYIDDESVIDHTRRICWSKVNMIRKYLDRYDYLIWVDADTHILNQEISLKYMLSFTNEKTVIAYQKDPFIWVNTGWMLVKRDPKVHELLEECYKDLSQICDEQGSLDALWRRNWNNCQEWFTVLEYSSGFNQLWFNFTDTDFMVHFPGCHEKELKEDTLTYMMRRFCPYKRDNETEREYTNRISENSLEKRLAEWHACRSRGRCLPEIVYS